MALPKKVKIVDVGPRDGLQNEKRDGARPRSRSSWSTACRRGPARRSRSTSFVSPEVGAADGRQRRRDGRHPRASPACAIRCWCPTCKGFDAALAARPRRGRRVRRGHRGVLPAQHQLLDRREPRALRGRSCAKPRARRACACAATISCVLGCPYEGEVDARAGGAGRARLYATRLLRISARPTPSASARRARCSAVIEARR